MIGCTIAWHVLTFRIFEEENMQRDNQFQSFQIFVCAFIIIIYLFFLLIIIFILLFCNATENVGYFEWRCVWFLNM